MDRRRFLGTAGAGLASTLGEPARGAAGAPRIRRYPVLGGTGLRVSDISFGASRLDDPRLVRHAYARGVTYFDTAESYRWGRSEEAIGEALVGLRERVVIASKAKAGAGDRGAEMMRALEASLRRLRTDYLDIYYNHAVNDLDRLRNPEWREFTERARGQGKIRFRGVSGHGGRLVDCLRYALDHDLADVILVAFSFGQDPDFYDTLRHLFHFVAMKTLMGARLNDLRPYEGGGATFAQAALRWVFASGKADAALISMTAREEIDEYLGASGATRLGARDLALLARYAALGRGARPGRW